MICSIKIFGFEDYPKASLIEPSDKFYWKLRPLDSQGFFPLVHYSQVELLPQYPPLYVEKLFFILKLENHLNEATLNTISPLVFIKEKKTLEQILLPEIEFTALQTPLILKKIETLSI